MVLKNPNTPRFSPRVLDNKGYSKLSIDIFKIFDKEKDFNTLIFYDERRTMEEQNKDSDTITIKKENLWKYSTFVLLAVIIVGGFLYFNKDSPNTTGSVVDGGDGVPAIKSDVGVDDDAVLGNKDAKVTIIEFSDYQCPFCRKFWTETYSELKKNYVDTGKVKLIFRDFPLTSIHPSSQIASEAAECVREKGGDAAYWKMHDKLFEEQNILDSGTKAGPVTKTAQFTAADLKKWAKEIGYDIESCLDSGKYSGEVQKDMADASAAGVQGTPSFFINGKMLGGAYPYSEFKKIIDAELG